MKSNLNKVFSKLSYASLFLWILIFQLIGYSIGKLSQDGIVTWYKSIIKSPLNPPDFIFPIVWGVLYVLLAFIGWHLHFHRNKLNARFVFNVYAIQMIMNWFWTPLFFQFHLIGLGFFWIVGIVFFVLMAIFASLNKFNLISILLVPYLVWLIYAGYLNYFIWVHN